MNTTVLPRAKNRPAVFIETYGCAFNQADSEAMAGVLGREGYDIAPDEASADVLILNSCTVKDRTYRDFQKRFERLRHGELEKQGPKIVLAGCIPKASRDAEWLAGVPALGPDAVGRVAEVVRGALDGVAMQVLDVARQDSLRLDRLNLPTRRANPTVEIIPISSGCLSACSFCQTRLARGTLQSFAPGDILRRAARAIEEGVAEIWLTSQDVGAWGYDLDYPLPRLLSQLCALEGDFRIRLGMSSPIWIHRALDAFLDALEHPRMFQFLHVPLQSGSDRVLNEMRRGNDVGQFIEINERFRARFPDGALITDLIVGYPTETENDFQATLNLVEQVRPAGVNWSRFSPRPGTAAAALARHPAETLDERSRRLGELVRRVARDHLLRWLGRQDRVRTAELKKAGSTVAHNRAYRPVVLEGEWPLGQWVDVAYHDCGNFHLKARPLGQSASPPIGN